MAPSLKRKAECLGPRFYDYLNGLREEFERQSNTTTKPRRFNSYLDGLECEFEPLTEDVESLRKEFKVKAMELRNVLSKQCNLKETASSSQSIASCLLKNLENGPSSSSPLAIQSKFLKMSSLIVNPSPHPPTQHMESRTTRSSQSVTITIPRCSDPIVAQTVTSPSPFKQKASVSTADLDSGPDCLNDGVGKELSIDMVHALSHEQPISCINFSQDGKYLAAGSEDGKSYIYDVQSGTLIHVLRDLLAKKEHISAVRFSPNGRYLATSSLYGSIYIWEINTKYVRNAFKQCASWLHSLDFSPNGRLLVSISNGNCFQLWNMRDGSAKEFRVTDDNPEDFYSYYTSAVFSPGPDGALIAASHTDGMVRVWHVCTCRLIRRVRAHKSDPFDTSVRFTPDGMGLVTKDHRTLKYWDTSSWNGAFVLAKSQKSDLDGCASAPEDQTLPERKYSGHKHVVFCIAISPDGRYVASGSFDRTLRVWDTRSGAVQCSLDHKKRVNSVDFSPAGHYLASGGGDGAVRIWRYSPRHSGSMMGS